MKKRKQLQKNSLFILYFPALFLLTLMASGCSSKQPQHVSWHQHYRAIENQDINRFVAKNLSEAIATFGPPVTPVTEHHVRQSIVRTDYDMLRQADILDWPLLATKILAYHDCLRGLSVLLPPCAPLLTSLQEISQGRNPNFIERQDVTSIINSLILDQTSLRAQILTCLQDDPQPPSRLLTKQLHLKKDFQNREAISILFSPAILPAPQKRRIKKGLEVCEIIDKEKGVFVLYVSVPKDDKAFQAQLSHETFHMLNPYLFDWYMEGLCNVFAEEMAKKLGFPWEKMGQYLESRRHKDPYAIAYFMMKELQEICGTDLHTILHFTVWTDEAQTKMHIDINAWLKSLPQDTQQAVISAITKASRLLKKHQGRRNTFTPVLFDQFTPQ